MSKGMTITAICKAFLLKIGNLRASSPAPYSMRLNYKITIWLFPFLTIEKSPKTTAAAGKMFLAANNFMFVMQKNGSIMRIEKAIGKACFENVFVFYPDYFC